MAVMDKVQQYISLLKVWNKKINLVQHNTLKDIINRHINDSLQIKDMLNENDTILDIGSGAGLPGVILSIYGFQKVILCENNFKKVVFLREVKRQLGLNYNIFADDIYKFDTSKYTEITAVSRAFASLLKLLEIMHVLNIPKGVFHKGVRYKNEILVAKQYYEFDCNVIQSIVPIQNIQDNSIQSTSVQGTSVQGTSTQKSVILKIQNVKWRE